MIQKIAQTLFSFLPFDLSKNQRYLTKNAGSTIAITSASLFLRIAFLVLLYFGTDVSILGKFICYLIFLDICSFLASLGIPQYIYQKLPQLAKNKKGKELRTLIKFSTKVCFWGSVVFTLVSALTYWLFLKEHVSYWAMFAFLASIPLYSILKLREESLKALGHTLSGYLGNDILGMSINIIGLALLGLLGYHNDFDHLVYMFTVSLIISYIVTVFLYTLKVKIAYREYDWQLFSSRWLIGSVGYFGITAIDKGLLYVTYGMSLIIFGFAESSIYWLLIEIVSFTTLVPTIINNTLLPFYQNSIKNADFNQLNLIIKRSRTFSFLFTLILSLLIAGLYFALALKTNFEYKLWLPVLVVLLASCFIDNLSSPRSLLLVIQKQGKTVIQSKLIALLSTISLGSILLFYPKLWILACVYLFLKIVYNSTLLLRHKKSLPQV